MNSEGTPNIESNDISTIKSLANYIERIKKNIKSENFLLAIEFIEKKALRQYPDSAELFLWLGVALDKVKSFSKAFDSYSKAIELQQKQPFWVYSVVVERLQWLNKLDLAIQYGHRGINLYPQQSEIYRQLAIAYEKNDNLCAAIKHYETAIKLKLKQPLSLYVSLLGLLSREGKIDHFFIIYAHLSELYPNHNSSSIYNSLGDIYKIKGNYPQAIDAYQISLKIDPKQSIVSHQISALNFNLAVRYLEKNNIELAIKHFRQTDRVDEVNNLELYWLEQNKNLWPETELNFKKSFAALLPEDKVWPRITVVTPSLNQGKYIEDTILSVINQKYDNLEYIVVDGLSSDNTLEILNKYQQRITHIVREEDLGQSDAINKGFALGTGELMMWLNSDDMLYPGALYAIAITYLNNQCNLIAGICAVHRNSKIIAVRKPKVRQKDFNVVTLSDICRSWSKGHFFFQPETAFTRDLWLKSGGKLDVELSYSMDHDLWLRFALNDARLEIVDYPIALFRKHSEQKTANALASISELAIVTEKYYSIQPSLQRQLIIDEKLKAFHQQSKPKIALIFSEEKTLNSIISPKLPKFSESYECSLISLPELKSRNLSDFTLIILILTPTIDVAIVKALKETYCNTLVIGWMWTDVLDFYLNSQIVDLVDICIPKSNLLGKIIKNSYSLVLSDTNFFSIQYFQKKTQNLFGLNIDNKLFNVILIKPNIGTKINDIFQQMNLSVDLLVEKNYYELDFEEKIAMLSKYKVCVCSSSKATVPSIAFDALFSGVIVVLVGKMSDISEVFSSEDLKNLPLFYLENSTYPEILRLASQGVYLFDEQGLIGKERRHKFVIHNNYLLDNNLKTLLQSLPRHLDIKSKLVKDIPKKQKTKDMIEDNTLVFEEKKPLLYYIQEVQDCLDLDPDRATALMEKAIEFYPQKSEAYRQLGIVQEKQANLLGQIESYTKAIAFDSNQPFWVYSVLVERLQMGQKLDEAARIAQQGITLYPDQADLHRNLGVVRDLQGNTLEMIDSYSRAIALDTKQPFWVYCALSENLCWQDKASEAEKIARQGIDIYSENPELLRHLGLALQQQGDLQEAIECYVKAIQFKSSQPANVYAALVTLYKDLNQLNKAISICQQAIEVVSENNKTQFVYLLRELTFLTTETNLDNFESYYNQGKALSELERWDEAIVYFKKAVANLIRENSLEEYESIKELKQSTLVCGKYKTYPDLTGERQDEGGLRLSNIYKRGTKDKPLVTIITAVYNNSTSFDRCINSVLGQKYSQIEYIIIDGGSEKPTLDLIHKYRDKIDYFVSEPDGGIYNAMNKGVELAQGDYVCVLNSDDWYSPDFVSSSVETAQSKGSSVVYTYCNHGPEQWITPGINEGIFLTHLNINHASFLVSKDCYNRVGKYSEDYQIVSDMLWKHDAFQNGEQFDLVPDFLFNFSHGGLSSGSNAKRKELMFSEIRRLTKRRFAFLNEDESDEIYKLRFDKNRVSVMLELIEKYANQKPFVASLTKYIEYCFQYRDNYKLRYNESDTAFPVFIKAAEKLSIPKSSIRIETKYGCFSQLISSIDAITAKKKANTRKVILHFATLFSTASETFIYDLLNRLEDNTVFDNYILFDRRQLSTRRPYDKCLCVHWGAYRPEVRDELYKHIFATIKPDVVIAHFALNEWKLQQRLAPLNIAVPTISMTHGIDVFTMGSKEAYKTYLVEDFSKREDTFFTTVSHYLRKELEKYGIPKDKISVIPNTVNERFFEHRKSNYFQKGDTLKLLNLGRLIDWKGHIDLLQGVRYFQDNCYENLHLTIVYGYGEDYYEQTVAEIERLNLTSKVTLKSFVDLSKEPGFFQTFDLYIQSSTYSKDGLNKSETFGVAVLEAITAGLPVIVTDAGGLPEVVGKENKFARIVPHGDGISIGKALQELFNKGECFSDNREYAKERLSYFSNKKQTLSLAKEIIKVSQGKLNATLFSSVTVYGAGYAAFRVHKGLRFTSINPTLFTKGGQHRKYPNIKVLDNPTPNVDSWNAWNILQNPSISKPELTIFSINHPFLTAQQISSMAEKADVISLHWTARFLSIENIAQLSNMGKPLLMTIRDMNPLTGGCHYFHGCNEWQRECSDCPQLVDTWDDYPSKVLRAKRKYYNFENLTIVTISNHTAEIIKKVPYFNQCRVEVITNSIETDVFKPYSKTEARKTFGLPLDRKIIAYVPSFSSTVKGYREAIEAFEILEQKYKDLNPYIMLLGNRTPVNDTIKLENKSIGYISDNDKLAMAYSAADVTIVPSLEETFSNTTAESISCGTPVVGFKTGAIPDMAQDGVTGYTFTIGDVAGLAEGIHKTLTGENLSGNCRKYAVENLSFMLQAKKREKLFYELYTYNKMPKVSVSQSFSSYFEETTPTTMNLLVSRLLNK